MDLQLGEKEILKYTPKDDARTADALVRDFSECVITGNGAGEPAKAVPRKVVSPKTPTESYQYEPVSQPDGIRCLVLEGATGAADDPLIGSLHHHNLADEPEFEAISYVWGTSQKTHTIICDGRKIAITKNLHTALMQARVPNEERALWADSICINQDDLTEKGHQVTMMSRIYSGAKGVLICLGPDEDGHANDAADLVSAVSQWVLATAASTDGSFNSYPYSNRSEWPNTDRRWSALATMTSQDWFERGWVVQEAGLARHAQILWGGTSILWISTVRTLTWLISRSPNASGWGNYPLLHFESYLAKGPEEISVLGVPQPHGFGLLYILHLGADLNFGDERDHIYAFLGLPGAASARHGFEVTYKAPYLEVYLNFASWYINTTLDLSILHYVHHDSSSLLEDFPSWVPQWHMLRPLHVFTSETGPIKSASEAFERALLPTLLRNKLTVHGLLIDRIVWTSQILQYNTTIEDVTEIWTHLGEHSADSAYREFHPLLAFCYAIRAGEEDPTVSHIINDANQAEYMLRLQNGKPLPADLTTQHNKFNSVRHHGDITWIHSCIQDCLEGHRLAITDRGYYGVVPGASQVDDAAAIIYGAEPPYIIRRNGLEKHYKLVGHALLVSAKLRRRRPCPLGSRSDCHQDWLEWNLEEQEINIV